MSTVQFVRDLFGDQEIFAIKEWVGPNGEMGVYCSQAMGHLYLLIFIQAQHLHYTHQYLDTERSLALRDAEIIAVFAGAQEIVA
ncbi:hypothetical protein [Ktedonospora formicarum]|uniref:Uncharacterized protein n=1 Tax=Ktedonospora formicarum TaxID=2778364 RepID=A0A8J3MVU5_9CHLR|nr:hypothetical protein [Ktedonospora formicarum]GHO48296.1 hypothetical protein KSX_64590 [Ktedonospora formicarum]